MEFLGRELEATGRETGEGQEGWTRGFYDDGGWVSIFFWFFFPFLSFFSSCFSLAAFFLSFFFFFFPPYFFLAPCFLSSAPG